MTHSGVTRGRTAQGDSIQGWHPNEIIFCSWIYKEHSRNDGEGGSGNYETTAKTGHRFQSMMIKKWSFFRKNRVTASVAAPGDTKLSDATDDANTIHENTDTVQRTEYS